MFEGSARAARREHDLAMQAAWITARLPGLKRFPPLKDMLAPEPRRAAKRQDWRELYRMVEAWVSD